MTRKVTAYKCWASETNKAVSPEFLQFIELTCTAANTDTAWDFSETAGNLWGDAEADLTYGAVATAAKARLYDFAKRADYFYGIIGALTEGRARLAAASGDHYAQATGTLSNIPNLTFNSGNAPTLVKIVLAYKMKAGDTPLNCAG